VPDVFIIFRMDGRIPDGRWAGCEATKETRISQPVLILCIRIPFSFCSCSVTPQKNTNFNVVGSAHLNMFIDYKLIICHEIASVQ
jgi:hypothetical protein